MVYSLYNDTQLTEICSFPVIIDNYHRTAASHVFNVLNSKVFSRMAENVSDKKLLRKAITS